MLSPHPRRPSALAEVDGAGRLVELLDVDSDDEILAGVPAESLLAIDAPLEVPNEHGNRGIERLIAWCDVPLFPVAGVRLDKVVGGRRGVDLAPSLRSAAAVVVEASPELILRQLIFEQQRRESAPLDLARYREIFLQTRAPAYRPKGAGRAKPAGLEPATRILAHEVDLGAYAPADGAGDLEAIADAARLDAIACAYAAHRALEGPAPSILIGAPREGEMLLPVDANLLERLEINLGRMRAQGELPPAMDIRPAAFA
jgi:predicted nuclease with RNAse H fold